MVKTLISPLAILLLATVVRAVIGIMRPARTGRGLDIILLAAALSVWAISIPPVSDRLVRSLDLPFASQPEDGRRAVTVVLAGGSYFDAAGRQHLASATVRRVIRGVEVYRQSGSSVLIMSGRGGGGTRRSQVSLMKELAVRLGIPAGAIALEPRARNTFEHPRELLRSGLARPADRVFVVTDALHLRRSTGEFRRLFPFTVPAGTNVPARSFILASFVPQADSLDQSTRAVREWIGMGWYALRNAWSDEPADQAVKAGRQLQGQRSERRAVR